MLLYTAGTQTELFANLVRIGEERTGISLPEMLESYMVFMLQRHLRNTNISNIVLALEYLENIKNSLHDRHFRLADTADAGLIISGFFPERAKRLNVSQTYFMDMSQICFLDLAIVCGELKHKGEETLYRSLGENVDSLVKVLYASREENKSGQIIDFSASSIGVQKSMRLN